MLRPIYCLIYIYCLKEKRLQRKANFEERARFARPLNTWCIFRGGSAQSVSFLFQIQGVRLARTFPCNNEIHRARVACKRIRGSIIWAQRCATGSAPLFCGPCGCETGQTVAGPLLQSATRVGARRRARHHLPPTCRVPPRPAVHACGVRLLISTFLRKS